MTTRKRLRLTRMLVLGLTLAGLAVPTAQAYIPADEPAATIAQQSPAARGYVDPPWAAVGADGTPAGAAPARPDDRSDVRGPGTAPLDTPATVVRTPGGFDWTDAGIGAGFAVGLVLLAVGVGILALRYRKSSMPTV